MRNNLAKRAILQLVFLSTLLIFLSLTNVPGQTPQPIYKVGDYFVYKVEATVIGNGMSCSVEWTSKYNITKIDFPYVYVRQIITDVKISGTCPPDYRPPTSGTVRDINFRIDKKPSESPQTFVDPSYSGTFQTSTTAPSGTYSSITYSSITYKYSKGVLISGSSEVVLGKVKISFKFNLIETSVPGLISDNIIWWIIIGVIVAVVVTVVIVTLYIVMRRRKALVQPAPPSVTPLAPNYCPNCGSPISPEAVYCGKCGRKLR
jgi:hypothetical protein